MQFPEAAFQSVLDGMGMPADRSGLYVEMVKAFNSGWIHFGNPGNRQVSRAHGIEAFAQKTGQVKRQAQELCRTPDAESVSV